MEAREKTTGEKAEAQMDLHQEWTKAHGESPTTTRLFEVTYMCALCGFPHLAEAYIAVQTDNLDDLYAKANETFRSQQFMVPTLLSYAKAFHTAGGDLEPLMGLIRNGQRQAITGIVEIFMTSESEFQCDECARKFDTLTLLRNHMGIDSETGSPVRGYDCDPE